MKTVPQDVKDHELVITLRNMMAESRIIVESKLRRVESIMTVDRNMIAGRRNLVHRKSQ